MECMYGGCNKESTKSVPCRCGRKIKKSNIRLCDIHYKDFLSSIDDEGGIIMGLNDNINDNEEVVVVCPLCHEKYRQTQCEQADGRRDNNYDVCPNCGSVNSASVRVRFLNRKL